MKRNSAPRWAGNVKSSEMGEWYREKIPVRVLLAEDNDDMRSLLAETMRERGFEVIEVSNGSEAIERVMFDNFDPHRTSNIDVIVLDVYMPGATGIEVLERLRESNWYTTVILISAFADDVIFKEAKRLGGATVLRKPFSLEVFLNKVEDAAISS